MKEKKTLSHSFLVSKLDSVKSIKQQYLLKVLNKQEEALHKSKFVDATFLDLQKAFNT